MGEFCGFKIKSGKEAEYKDFREKNISAPYAKCIIDYTERWGGMMDRAIDEGKTIQEMAKELSNAANKEQITLYMYGTAVRILSTFWEHGEELRQWHNQGMRVESRGVVHPAIWTTVT